MSKNGIDRFDEFCGALEAIVGARYVSQGEAIPEALLDEPRKRFLELPLASVRPADQDQVAAVVRLCAQHGLPMITRGGGSGTVGGASAVPVLDQVLISLDRMRALREVDPVGSSLTAEAGMTLAEARRQAQAHELEVPLWLASEGSATLGGIIASNAGGNTTIRHGNARAMLRGLAVVLADGRVLDLSAGLRKDNTGYDLCQLIAGSEGTLGIITGVTLGLVPRSRQRLVMMCALDSPSRAMHFLQRVRAGLGEHLTAFEILPRFALELVLNQIDSAHDPFARAHPWYVLLEAGTGMPGDWLGPAGLATAEAALNEGWITDAVVAESGAQADALWQLREAISPAQRQAGASIKHDVSVPVIAIPELIETTLPLLERRVPGIRPCIFGHAGDGNLHFNLSRPPDLDDDAFMQREAEINEIVFDRVQAFGGSIAAEHGIGQLRRDELARRGDPVRLDVLRAIKRALDPSGLLNPGKLID